MKNYLFVWANFFGSDHEVKIQAQDADSAIEAFKQSHALLFDANGNKLKPIRCFLQINW